MFLFCWRPGSQQATIPRAMMKRFVWLEGRGQNAHHSRMLQYLCMYSTAALEPSQRQKRLLRMSYTTGVSWGRRDLTIRGLTSRESALSHVTGVGHLIFAEAALEARSSPAIPTLHSRDPLGELLLISAAHLLSTHCRGRHRWFVGR